MLADGGCPVVIIAGGKGQLLPHALIRHHKRTRGHNVRGMPRAEALHCALQGRIGKQTRAGHGHRLRELRGRLREIKLHRVRVQRLRTLVVRQRGARLETTPLVPQPKQVKITHHIRRVHVTAVGIGDVFTQLKRELRGILIHLRQRRGDPRIQIQRHRILKQQAIRDVVNNPSIRVKIRRRRVQGIELLGLYIGNRATNMLPWLVGAGGDRGHHQQRHNHHDCRRFAVCAPDAHNHAMPT